MQERHKRVPTRDGRTEGWKDGVRHYPEGSVTRHSGALGIIVDTFSATFINNTSKYNINTSYYDRTVLNCGPFGKAMMMGCVTSQLPYEEVLVVVSSI